MKQKDTVKQYNTIQQYHTHDMIIGPVYNWLQDESSDHLCYTGKDYI